MRPQLTWCQLSAQLQLQHGNVIVGWPWHTPPHPALDGWQQQTVFAAGSNRIIEIIAPTGGQAKRGQAGLGPEMQFYVFN